MKKNLFLSFLIFHSFFSQAQRLLESDIIHGGFTMGGAISVFAGKLIKSKIQIPPGSTIKKVYFLAAEDRKKENVIPPRKVWINDTLFAHHEFTRFTGPFVSSWAPLGNITFNGSFMHVLDITQRFNYVGDTLYVNISEVTHNPYIGYFNTYTILLIFENPTLPRMAYSVFLNEQDVTHYYTFPLQFPHPVQTTRPVGFGIWGWHMCNAGTDGSNIFVNHQYIGRVGGEEPNGGMWCNGVYPNFAYYNDSLFAFDGDTPDSLMAGPDATANIQAYIPHLADTLLIQSNYQSPNFNYDYTNPVGGLFFAYTTPCDTFSAAVGPRFLNHLCPGDTMQLWATGGVRYEWSPAIGLSCYDCPNPVFRHDSSMAYTVRIYNNDTCSKVLPVKVNVNYPRFGYTVKPATCGLANATVIAHPLWPERQATYALDTLVQTDSLFTQQPGGMGYHLILTDAQGCQASKVVFVPETIPTFAGFITQPTEGNAPLDVNFLYTGGNATHFHWYFGDGDSLYNTTQPTAQHTYAFAGTYHPYLIAWLHAPHCTDTFYQQVTVHPALHVAELLTPNGDQHNDTWQIQGIESYPQLAVKVLNRWGDVVYSAQPYTNTWNGDNLPSGTYFWVVYPLGIDNTPEDEVIKGFLELRR